MSSTVSQCLNPDCLRPNPINFKFCEKCGIKLLLGDRYRAIKIIGQGGFGRTFLAVDEQKPSKPRCVIKQFFPQAQGTNNAEKAAQLFEQEAVRLDELGHHDQIPELLAYLTQDGRQYLVQEFVDGQNLAQELEEASSAFTESQIRELLNDILPVLEFIHSGQVIHRDIKPENIIRRQRDNKLVLVDFGAAKFATGTALARTGTIIGSAEYLAPEQGRGKAVFGSDLYSLGVTCIYLLTQVSPFDLFDINEDAWIWRQFLVNNPVSDNLGQVLDKLIQNAVSRRYQLATEVLKALNPQQSVQPQPTQSVSSKQPSSKSTTAVEQLPNSVVLEMVAIPAGSFLMGSPNGEGNDSERPQHWVKVSSFYMGKYPVTNAQWKAVMRTDPASSYTGFGGSNQPVINVSWYEAQEFCQKLSRLSGKKYRLPSEAEWEYACRAGATTAFYFGENINTKQVNYDGNYPYKNAPKGEYWQRTTQVGKFPVNSFGLYDMHGNVWEWCEDEWHENYSGAPTDGSAWINQNENSSRDLSNLLRGGSWVSHADYCRSAYRDRYHADFRFNFIGFRVVYS
ncbi:MAG TPA: SUMF1/EgtB/PvdO family nonheme iron enzyme [Candidatus Obscuribacterales bacterium]